MMAEPLRRHTVNEPLAVLAERDATIAALRDELHYANGTCDLAMKHRDEAETEIVRLRSGITAAVEGRYERVAMHGLDMCIHGTRPADPYGEPCVCLGCVYMHLRALLDPQAPDAGEGQT